MSMSGESSIDVTSVKSKEEAFRDYFRVRKNFPHNRTVRLEVLSYVGDPLEENTDYKFHQILQGSRESIIAQAEKIAEELNAYVRVTVPVAYNRKGFVTRRNAVWGNF